MRQSCLIGSTPQLWDYPFLYAFITSKYLSELANRNVGPVARTNAIEILFQVGCGTPRVQGARGLIMLHP